MQFLDVLAPGFQPGTALLTQFPAGWHGFGKIIVALIFVFMFMFGFIFTFSHIPCIHIPGSPVNSVCGMRRMMQFSNIGSRFIPGGFTLRRYEHFAGGYTVQGVFYAKGPQ